MRGYWKLWHDVSARFLVACLVVTWQVYATSVGAGANHVFGLGHYQRPTVCRPAVSTDKTATETAARLDRIAELKGREHNMIEKVQAHNYRVLAGYCGANQRPTEDFARAVSYWTTAYVNSVWGAMMPLLMLFMGVLISVGPPFSGESSEASTLTFSLPWSRGRWMREKVKLSMGLIALLILPAYAVGRSVTTFDHIPMMWGTMFMYVDPMHFSETLPAFLCGAVGIALGISATMLTRHALIGAVCAGITAYILAMFNYTVLYPSMRSSGSYMTLLDLDSSTGIFVAFTVIIGAIGLSYVRLRRTDF